MSDYDSVPVVAGGYFGDSSKHWPKAHKDNPMKPSMSEVILCIGGESWTRGQLHDFGLEMGEFVSKWDDDNNDGQWVRLGAIEAGQTGIFRDAWTRALGARLLHDFPYVDDLESCQSVKCFNCDAYARLVTEFGRQLITIQVMEGGEA